MDNPLKEFLTKPTQHKTILVMRDEHHRPLISFLNDDPTKACQSCGDTGEISYMYEAGTPYEHKRMVKCFVCNGKRS